MAESLDGADTSVLPEEDLEEENGESGREQHEEVRDLEFERFLLSFPDQILFGHRQIVQQF